MFDSDYLRNQQLIEEREAYENDFISSECIIKSDEMDYYTTPHFEEYFLGNFEMEKYAYEEDLDLEFDFEDYFIQLRDEQLIEQREIYEREYLPIPEEIVEFDSLDILADSYEEIHEPDFCDYDFFDDYYVEEYNMDAAYCGDRLFGYIVDDNESFEEYDYPEGPDENIGGFRYPEPDYIEDPCFDFPDEYYDFPEPDYEMEYYDSLDLAESEEIHMQKLINQHIAEEKEFLEFIANEEIPDEYFPPEVVLGEIVLS